MGCVAWVIIAFLWFVLPWPVAAIITLICLMFTAWMNNKQG